MKFFEVDADEPELAPLQEEDAEILHFYGKFQALNFYYAQVNRVHGGGVAPSFYRYRLAPLSGPRLNRAYEVEEHVGRGFLDEVAELHLSQQQGWQDTLGLSASTW